MGKMSELSREIDNQYDGTEGIDLEKDSKPKIEWIYNGNAGTCAITGCRTAWTAKTEHGSIYCMKDSTRTTDVVVWNKIIDVAIEGRKRWIR